VPVHCVCGRGMHLAPAQQRVGATAPQVGGTRVTYLADRRIFQFELPCRGVFWLVRFIEAFLLGGTLTIRTRHRHRRDQCRLPCRVQSAAGAHGAARQLHGCERRGVGIRRQIGATTLLGWGWGWGLSRSHRQQGRRGAQRAHVLHRGPAREGTRRASRGAHGRACSTVLR
jgi:hypothetical protein